MFSVEKEEVDFVFEVSMSRRVDCFTGRLEFQLKKFKNKYGTFDSNEWNNESRFIEKHLEIIKKCKTFNPDDDKEKKADIISTSFHQMEEVLKQYPHIRYTSTFSRGKNTYELWMQITGKQCSFEVAKSHFNNCFEISFSTFLGKKKKYFQFDVGPEKFKSNFKRIIQGIELIAIKEDTIQKFYEIIEKNMKVYSNKELHDDFSSAMEREDLLIIKEQLVQSKQHYFEFTFFLHQVESISVKINYLGAPYELNFENVFDFNDKFSEFLSEIQHLIR